MGSHPIGLEAAADINPAASLSTQTVTVYTRHSESCSKERRAVLETVPLHEVPLRLQGEYFAAGQRKDTQLGKGGRAGTGNPRFLEPRKGPSARTGSKSPKERGARGTDHGCCSAVFERSRTSEP
jgi:hypothetical protein